MIPRVGTCTKLAAKIQDTHRKGLELKPNDCQYTPQKSAGKRSTWVASFGSWYQSAPQPRCHPNKWGISLLIDDAMYLLSEQTFPHTFSMGQLCMRECQNSADFCSNPGIMMGINQKPELC